jgi:hypothetical protein
LPFDHDARFLAAADTWNLICSQGEFDISFRPAGFDRESACGGNDHSRPRMIGRLRQRERLPE